MEECQPGHSYGPAVRDHFLIHFIKHGKGVFTVGEHNYSLATKQGFLICPGIVTFYQASQENPWSYSWLGFQGRRA